MRLTIRYTRPQSSGACGYTGQDEYSRKWIDRVLGTHCVSDNRLPELVRSAGTFAHTVEILPTNDKPPSVPECTEF